MPRLNIGSVPIDEPCLSVAAPPTDQKFECRVFAKQISRYYPIPQGAGLLIETNNHDFGVYYEIACKYNNEDEQQTAWALDVEDDSLQKLQFWDEQAVEELKAHPNYYNQLQDT